MAQPTSTVLAPDEDDTAQTNGWDTVFAIHITDANAAIVRAASSPTSFQAVDQADGYTIAGTFGVWQIVTGDSGELIRFSIPLTQCTITEPAGKKEDITGTAVVLVRLAFIDEDASCPPAGGTNTILKVKITPATSAETPSSVTSISFDGRNPTFLGEAALRGLLEKWLNANL